jgi:hypothetical protein
MKAVLCDPGLYGISLAEGSYDTVDQKITDDVRYVAPELRIKNKKAHPTRATDIYALGGLGYEVRLLSICGLSLTYLSSSFVKGFIHLTKTTSVERLLMTLQTENYQPRNQMNSTP